MVDEILATILGCFSNFFSSGTLCSSMAVLMSSCISLAICRVHGRSGVVIVMILEGVDRHVVVLGVDEELDAGMALTTR